MEEVRNTDSDSSTRIKEGFLYLMSVNACVHPKSRQRSEIHHGGTENSRRSRSNVCNTHRKI